MSIDTVIHILLRKHNVHVDITSIFAETALFLGHWEP